MPHELSKLGISALELAELGYAVFPCKPRGKAPLTRHGFKEATTDPEKIRAWWTRWPDANIGIATGAMSGVLVVDVDGEAGEKLLADLEAAYGRLPPTGGAKTGKGRHLYFTLPNGLGKVPSPRGGGLDMSGDDAYVVAPPSIHPSGAIYTWEHLAEGSEYPVAPEWLLDFARNRKSAGGTKVATNGAAGLSKRRSATRQAGEGSKSLHAALSNVTAPAAPPSQDREGARLISALSMIPATERDVWLRVGAALYDTGWPGARAGWDAWSRTAPEKFDPAGQDATWGSFGRPYDGARATLATVYALAMERGWTDPTSPLAAVVEGVRTATARAAVEGVRAPLTSPKIGVDFALFPRTDAGNAEAFLALYGEDLRYVEAWGSWLVWDGSRWVETSALSMLPHAIQTAREMLSWAVRQLSGEAREAWVKHALATEKAARLSDLLKLASANALVKPGALDIDRWLLGCPNGTLDLRTGKLREARREDFITKQIGVAFDPTAECPQWLRFLGWATGGDLELAAFLQRFAGYALTGEVREETLCVFVGGGANGKSTLLMTLLDLMGDYAGKAPSDLLLHAQGKEGAPSPDVAALQGKRLVAVSETEDGGRLSEARVKDIVSNERIKARRLHRDPFEFAPTHKIILATNYRPRVHGTDHGIWRRLAPVLFGATVSEGEKVADFRERVLMPELSGILNWAVTGCLVWQRDGLRPPASVLAAAAEYRSSEDIVGQWAEERVERDDAAVVLFERLYQDYVNWIGPHGRPFGKQRFAEELDRIGFAKTRVAGGKAARCGLVVKPIEIPAPLRADPTANLASKLKVVK